MKIWISWTLFFLLPFVNAKENLGGLVVGDCRSMPMLKKIETGCGFDFGFYFHLHGPSSFLLFSFIYIFS